MVFQCILRAELGPPSTELAGVEMGELEVGTEMLLQIYRSGEGVARVQTYGARASSPSPVGVPFGPTTGSGCYRSVTQQVISGEKENDRNVS